MRWTMKRGCWRLIDECWRFSRWKSIERSDERLALSIRVMLLRGLCKILWSERHVERGLALELSSSLMEDALELRMASLAASFADLHDCLAVPVLSRRYRRSMHRQRFLATIASLESWMLGCWHRPAIWTDRFLTGACLSRRISSLLLRRIE